MYVAFAFIITNKTYAYSDIRFSKIISVTKNDDNNDNIARSEGDIFSMLFSKVSLS